MKGMSKEAIRAIIWFVIAVIIALGLWKIMEYFINPKVVIH